VIDARRPVRWLMHAGRCDSAATPRARRGAMGNGLGTMIKYLRRTKRGA
jgi:hypothetical protein